MLAKALTTLASSGGRSFSSFFTRLPDKPTRHTPRVTMMSDVHWYSQSRRRRKMTDKMPTQRTSAPRDIWYMLTGVRISPTFMSVVPQTGISAMQREESQDGRRTVEESREPHQAHPPSAERIIQPALNQLVLVLAVFA
jgi:hypothetical protein